MFAGEFRCRAETSGLFPLPPIFLAAFPPPEAASGRAVVLLKSLDQSLWLYEARTWDTTMTATRARLDAEQSRLLMHYVVAESALIDLDAQGRLAIPRPLRMYAGMTTDAVLLGMYDRIEIWGPTRWEAYLTSLEERQEPIIGKILDLL